MIHIWWYVNVVVHNLKSVSKRKPNVDHFDYGIISYIQTFNQYIAERIWRQQKTEAW